MDIALKRSLQSQKEDEDMRVALERSKRDYEIMQNKKNSPTSTKVDEDLLMTQAVRHNGLKTFIKERRFGLSIDGLLVNYLIVNVDLNKTDFTEEGIIKQIYDEGLKKIKSWGDLSILLDNYKKIFSEAGSKLHLQESIHDINQNKPKRGTDCFWLCYHPYADCKHEHKDHDLLPRGNLTMKENDTIQSLRKSINQLSDRVRKLELTKNY